MTPIATGQLPRRARNGPAFSLLEMVIVVVIMGVIAMIAIPRFGSAASGASDSTLLAQADLLQRAVDHYRAEHFDRSPAQNGFGVTSTDGTQFAKRLLLTTNVDGDFASGFGPYLRTIPVNAFNGSDSIEIDAGTPGDNSAGWYYNTQLGWIIPDDPRGLMLFRRLAGTSTVLTPSQPATVAPAAVNVNASMMAQPLQESDAN